jgi:hypothetical protein
MVSSNGGRTVDANIIKELTIGKDQEQLFTHRYSLATLGTIKRGCVEGFKALPGGFRKSHGLPPT